MQVTGRNKKCLFSSCSAGAVDKKDMTNKPAGNGIFNRPGKGSSAYFQMLQAVVIQHPVIYPLTGIPGGQTETVHKIIVRTQRRQFFGGSAADEDGQ